MVQYNMCAVGDFNGRYCFCFSLTKAHFLYVLKWGQDYTKAFVNLFFFGGVHHDTEQLHSLLIIYVTGLFTIC